MKILIITHTYSPDLNPRALRWTAIANELAHRGHDVHVLCATPSDTPSHTGVQVHRVQDPIYGRLHKYKSKTTPAQPQTLNRSRASLGKSFRNQAITTAKWLWTRLHWPDYAMGWIGPARQSVEILCSKHEFDWIISSSNPFSDHVVTMKCLRSIKKARWLVDLGDPYSQMKDTSPYNRWLFQAKSAKVEKQVLDRADRVSVTTVKTAQEFQRLHRIEEEKISVIPPLLSISSLPPPNRPPDQVIRMVYVGTLYRAIRNPAPALRCVSELLRAYPDIALELHFYGSLGDCVGEFEQLPPELNRKVVLHGLVSRERVLQAMVDADILLNIGNTTETQLPSKIVEYLSTGKPIIHLTQAKIDAAENLLAQYPAALSMRVSEEWPDKLALEKLVEFICKTPKVPAEQISRLIRPFLIPSITDQYLACMER